MASVAVNFERVIERAVALRVFLYATPFPLSKIIYVTADQRIKELTAQPLRAHNPAVIETVAAQLKEVIDEYVRNAAREIPLLEIQVLTNESAA